MPLKFSITVGPCLIWKTCNLGGWSGKNHPASAPGLCKSEGTRTHILPPDSLTLGYVSLIASVGTDLVPCL